MKSLGQHRRCDASETSRAYLVDRARCPSGERVFFGIAFWLSAAWPVSFQRGSSRSVVDRISGFTIISE